MVLIDRKSGNIYVVGEVFYVRILQIQFPISVDCFFWGGGGGGRLVPIIVMFNYYCLLL